MEWQPIETAPKGPRILCLWPNGYADFLMWKTNSRIIDAHRKGGMLEHAEDYFGDCNEWDDYELALPANAPKFWLPLEAPK